jgi:hypothetical protein
MSASVVHVSDLMLELLDKLAAVPTVDAETLGRDRQATVILESGVTHALESIRRGRPGYARFQLKNAELRAQRVLDGTVPSGSIR